MIGYGNWLNRALALLVLCLPGWTAAADGDALAPSRAAEAVVQQTSDDMLTLIEAARGYAQDDPERFYREVEALLSGVVDFRRFAGSVMAAYYKKATPEQRKRFADSFKWGLVRTYGLALTEFNDGKVLVVPARKPPRKPDRVSVKQEIHTASGDIYPVVYSMAQYDGGDWKMRNIIVNGVNMGLTYRNQFQSAAQDPQYDGDLDKVIDAWTDVLAAQAAETAEQAQAGPGTMTSQ